MSTKVLMILVAVATLAAAYFIRYTGTDPNYAEFLRRQQAGITDEVD